jgi:Rrf2 family protein
MKLSKSARYALLAAAEMARSRNDDPVTVGLVAKRHTIPENALAKVFQRLVRSGLAVGTRGVHGGYRLARRPSEITVLDVMNAFEPTFETGVLLAPRVPGGSAAPVVDRLDMIVDRVDEHRRSIFASVTLDMLVAETADAVDGGPSR